MAYKSKASIRGGGGREEGDPDILLDRSKPLGKSDLPIFYFCVFIRSVTTVDDNVIYTVVAVFGLTTQQKRTWRSAGSSFGPLGRLTCNVSPCYRRTGVAECEL